MVKADFDLQALCLMGHVHADRSREQRVGAPVPSPGGPMSHKAKRGRFGTLKATERSRSLPT